MAGIKILRPIYCFLYLNSLGVRAHNSLNIFIICFKNRYMIWYDSFVFTSEKKI